MVANCNPLGLQYLLWWVQGCRFWPLQSLRKLASLMVLHLGAGSLFSISRSRFRIACTLGILSSLLAWSAFSASQTKFWWPFRFFCLAIMLLCTLSQISFIAVFTAFECDIGSWASSASTEKPSLPRNNPFGHSGESWLCHLQKTCNCLFCSSRRMMTPELIHTWPEWTRQPPPVHTKEGWMVGGHRKHFSHWDPVPYLTWFELNCGFIKEPQPNDERLLMDGVLVVAVGSLSHSCHIPKLNL
jgi:hypothetical protein